MLLLQHIPAGSSDYFQHGSVLLPPEVSNCSCSAQRDAKRECSFSGSIFGGNRSAVLTGPLQTTTPLSGVGKEGFLRDAILQTQQLCARVGATESQCGAPPPTRPFYSQQEKADVLQVPISVLKMLFKTTGNSATGLQGHHGFVLSLLLPPIQVHTRTDRRDQR